MPKMRKYGRSPPLVILLLYNATFITSIHPHSDLFSMSQAFHDISLEMQSAGIPLISDVIPHMDDLVRVIDDFKDDASKHLAVRSAAI